MGSPTPIAWNGYGTKIVPPTASVKIAPATAIPVLQPGPAQRRDRVPGPVPRGPGG